MKDTAFSLIPLTDLTVISLTGADATTFLQSQLTQDITILGADRAALAGYCNARGRVQATMIAVQQGTEQSDGWLLLTKADGALAFAQRLRMFVLRAKVDVTVSEVEVIGVRVSRSDPTPESVEPENTEAPLETPLTLPATATPYAVVRQGARIWIQTPERAGSAQTRWWLLNAADVNASATASTLLSWQADDIAAGLPWVQAATQEAFIPQTLNMDLIDGVSFTKGCYPGQEVVARSHYRGTVKRRMAYAQGAAVDVEAVQDLPGVDTFDANKPGRPCGRVINAAVADDQLHILMEVQLSDLTTADFRLGSDDGHAVSIVPLPYEIQPEQTD